MTEYGKYNENGDSECTIFIDGKLELVDHSISILAYKLECGIQYTPVCEPCFSSSTTLAWSRRVPLVIAPSFTLL